MFWFSIKTLKELQHTSVISSMKTQVLKSRMGTVVAFLVFLFWNSFVDEETVISSSSLLDKSNFGSIG